MLKHWVQEKKQLLVLVAGTGIVPALLILAALQVNPFRVNFTGLAGNPGTRGLYDLSAAAAFLYLIAMLLDCSGGILHRSEIWLLAGLILTALLLPYHDAGDLGSSLHVLTAYLAFGLLNWLLTRIAWMYQDLRQLYLGMLVLCLLLVMTASSVTGIAELIYSCSLSILLCGLWQRLHAKQ